MKYKIDRDDNPKEVTKITVYIGLDRYRITESNEGKLNINKMSDSDSDNIQIHPYCSNEIELS